MKSNHEINERIKSLKVSSKNWVNNEIEIELLESSMLLWEKQIKIMIKNQLEHDKYKEIRILLWLLEKWINTWFF